MSISELVKFPVFFITEVRVGFTDGFKVGQRLGVVVGKRVGDHEGFFVGPEVGVNVLGRLVGTVEDGRRVGVFVIGLFVGTVEGPVGLFVGTVEGDGEGRKDGILVGAREGTDVGFRVEGLELEGRKLGDKEIVGLVVGVPLSSNFAIPLAMAT